MKTFLMKIIFAVLFMTLSQHGMTQELQPVYSIVRQVHDFDWYEQQAKLWKQEIDKGTTNNKAWFYWYEANRMAGHFCDFEKWESRQNDYFVPLDTIVERAEMAIPNTFEICYLMGKNKFSTGDPQWINDILKAQAIRPYDELLLPLLLIHYQIVNDRKNVELVCKKWFESNEMPQELLTMAYNMLISLEPDAILLVLGDNDVYPCWVLQNTLKIRPDVKTICISFAAGNREYHKNVCNELGIPQMKFEEDGNDMDSANQKFFKHLIENVHDKSINVSIFTTQTVYEKYADKMYLTGTSFKYSPKSFDNMAVLRDNFENKFMLDFLKHTFYNNYSQSVVNKMALGYLTVFYQQYKSYIKSGEKIKAKKIKELAKITAEKSGNTEWLNYFDKID